MVNVLLFMWILNQTSVGRNVHFEYEFTLFVKSVLLPFLLITAVLSIGFTKAEFHSFSFNTSTLSVAGFRNRFLNNTFSVRDFVTHHQKNTVKKCIYCVKGQNTTKIE